MTLLRYSSEWVHVTGSVSYPRSHVEAFCPALPHVELVPLQYRAETSEACFRSGLIPTLIRAVPGQASVVIWRRFRIRPSKPALR